MVHPRLANPGFTTAVVNQEKPWLDLIHPASPMHRATRWRQVCLSWADASTSSQVNPILWMSLFTKSLQFILGLPGPLLNPRTSHCIACFGMRTSSILMTWPSHRNVLSRITFSRSAWPVLFHTSSFVTLSLQVIPRGEAYWTFILSCIKLKPYASIIWWIDRHYICVSQLHEPAKIPVLFWVSASPCRHYPSLKTTIIPAYTAL